MAYDLISSVTWLQAGVEFVKALFGLITGIALPAVILLIVWWFREEFAELIKRGFKFKAFGLDVDTAPIQQPSTSATKVEQTPTSRSERDAEGSYSKTGIKQLVQDTSPRGEAVVDALLIFKTPKQHTWLVATQKKLYCVLDDADRRKTGELVQWALL